MLNPFNSSATLSVFCYTDKTSCDRYIAYQNMIFNVLFFLRLKFDIKIVKKTIIFQNLYFYPSNFIWMIETPYTSDLEHWTVLLTSLIWNNQHFFYICRWSARKRKFWRQHNSVPQVQWKMGLQWYSEKPVCAYSSIWW